MSLRFWTSMMLLMMALRTTIEHHLATCECEIEVEQCSCSGPQFLRIPSTLPSSLITLIIEDAGLEMLHEDSLQPYAQTLRELTLVSLEHFTTIKAGVFRNMSQLETLYIHRAPKLEEIHPEVFNAFLPNLKILRIVNTGLKEMPNCNKLITSSVLHMIDLEHNHIQRIKSRQMSGIKTGQLILNYNDIRMVEADAFYDSEIAKLSLKGNTHLTSLHRRAFGGLKSLREIDLSSTSITILPLEGLREIDVLKLQHVEALKVFPSVYNFQNIKEAWLTYPYHCCAFKFPHTHNPREFEQYQRLIKRMQSTCAVERNRTDRIGFQMVEEDEEEVFHNDTLRVDHEFPITTAVCGVIYRNYQKVHCYPAPDAFNPCEDIMGNWGLRVPVWLISLSAVVGNLCVIVVIATSHFHLTVSKFLICNLAVADLCIGIHLLLVTVVDACSIGTYFNFAIDWQEGDGCRVAGFLTIFGNVLSVYTLAVITSERWYTITWAIHLNKRLKLRTAVRVMVFGWAVAASLGILPLFGVSSYSKTSICLPLESHGTPAAIYLSVLLTLNAFAFLLVCACYGSMYRSIRYEAGGGGGSGGGTSTTVRSVRSDLTVAKRMALLVFTDFACWAPIAFFGMTALLGHPLITVTHTKYLLVFFYPLNACANPCLYALLTQQYRRDFFILMGRCGCCKDRAERHKGAIGGKPLPYGAGGQYRRSAGDTTTKFTTSGGNHRASMRTTLVEMPIMRTTSRNGAAIAKLQDCQFESSSKL